MTDTAITVLTVIAFLAGAGWIGEVITLNFIVVPSLRRMDDSKKAWFLSYYFPRFFRLATVLALSTVVAGSLAAIFGGSEMPILTYVGGGLIIALTLFHLLIESRLRPMARSLADTPDPAKIGFMTKFLNIVPRIGIVVIVTGFTITALSLG